MNGSGVDRLGFEPDHVVQEFGYDSDVDNDFRFAIEDRCGSELEDEDYTGSADAALLWWRDGDGDLGEALIDMVGIVEDGGFVVLVTPGTHAPGAIEASEIADGAQTAGLHTSGGSTPIGPDWRATKLVAPRSRSRR